MAKYFRCWVIVAGTQPTAFRAREADDLVPTLKQLQRTQPDVSLMWFERGRLWRSPEEARMALLDRRRTPSGRGRDWRPGGEHKDPKARPQVPRDEKRALFKKRLIAKKTRGQDVPPANSGPRPARPPGDRRQSGRPPGGSPDRRGPGGAASSRRPPGGSGPWRPAGPPKSGRAPSPGSSSRRPPSGPSSARRPPSGAGGFSNRRPPPRPGPSGRPGPGRPAKPPRRRNDK